MSKDLNETMMYQPARDQKLDTKALLIEVYEALIGYILSGDPTYITSHKNARNLIRKLERDELLGEILKDYLSS